jgi:hypothetical protein
MVFCKNRDRLLPRDIASMFFEGVVARLQEKNLLSDEQFKVDGGCWRPGREPRVSRARMERVTDGL